ncbi:MULTISPECIES: FxsA family protein [Halobacterium]|uniref:FxsA family protein n=1 Tax=Halobacterium TaxID=2239 RepID=UPI00073ECB82|nr:MULTISPECIES: FxsA family protein [Halobacterium]MCG1004034.1 membrane protein FxsA [Halobacterium noricense]
MPRLRWLFLALLVVPLADALFLVFVAGQVGWQVTVALVVLTALLGTLFVRAEGRHTLQRIQRSLAQGKTPTDELVDGGLLIAAGAFLLTPGLLTDALGFLLVFPLTRYPFRYAVKEWVIKPKLDQKTGGFATGNVYTFGFPGGSDDGGAGPFAGMGGGDGSGGSGPFGSSTTSSSDDDTIDLDEDSYDVEFEDGDDADTR